MTGHYRGARGVDQLLKIARSETEALRIDLADIDKAKAAAEAALEELAAAVEKEERAHGADASFAAYAEAMTERRFNLRKTLQSLEAAAEDVRDRLMLSLGEIAKLEEVSAVNARESANRMRKREARAEGEAALVRQKAI